MFLTRSRLLIVILTLLQVISPFIHAHTGQELTKQSLHLYEFEKNNFIHNALFIQDSDHSQFAESFIVCVGQSVQTLKKTPHHLNQFSLPSHYLFLRKEVKTFRVKHYDSYSLPSFLSDRPRIFLPRSPPKKKLAYFLS